MNYYFLTLSLPPLSLKAPLEISFEDLQEALRLNLTASDLKKVASLLSGIDLYNIKALWLGEGMDARGNFTEKELEEALLIQEGLPQCVIDYLQQYESVEDRLRFFPSLYVSFYQQMDVDSEFLKKYYDLERSIRWILSAFRAKMFGRDIVKEIQFEDPQDPLIAWILAQKDAKEFEPPKEFEDLKLLFMENSRSPSNLHIAILKYRMEKIEEMESQAPFTIDQILGYVARFLIVDEWFRLSPNNLKDSEKTNRYG
jgi:hypothetical protein